MRVCCGSAVPVATVWTVTLIARVREQRQRSGHRELDVIWVGATARAALRSDI